MMRVAFASLVVSFVACAVSPGVEASTAEGEARLTLSAEEASAEGEISFSSTETFTSLAHTGGDTELEGQRSGLLPSCDGGAPVTSRSPEHACMRGRAQPMREGACSALARHRGTRSAVR